MKYKVIKDPSGLWAAEWYKKGKRYVAIFSTKKEAEEFTSL